MYKTPYSLDEEYIYDIIEGNKSPYNPSLPYITICLSNTLALIRYCDVDSLSCCVK